MGNFVHIELNSTDHEKAKAFYTKVFGWKTMDMPMTGGSYTMVDGMMNPGIGMAAGQEGMPSAWTAYVDVDDVKKTVAKATKAGAQAVVPYMPVQGPDGSLMGEIAILVDPTGATFGIWHGVAQPESAAEPAAAPAEPATQKKASKKKAAKKKAAKKKASKKKAAAKKAPAKKAAKKKASKKKAAAKKAPAKKAAKKKTKKKASRKKKA